LGGSFEDANETSPMTGDVSLLSQALISDWGGLQRFAVGGRE
jgi:hypothetical protein